MPKRNPNSRSISITPSSRKGDLPKGKPLPANIFNRPLNLPPMKPIHEGTRAKLEAQGYLDDE